MLNVIEDRILSVEQCKKGLGQRDIISIREYGEGAIVLRLSLGNATWMFLTH